MEEKLNEEKKEEEKKKKSRWLWLLVLLLFLFVIATTIIVADRLSNFLIDDSGSIPLIPPDGGMEETQAPTAGQDPGDATDPPTEPGDTTPTKPAEPTQPPKRPGFEAGDDKTVWTTNTQVEIFRVSYENGEQVITMNSDDGDKLIAPGSQNTYTFKLKNTGNVALDYIVEINAYITPGDIHIPITARLNRYDGKWVVGGKGEYADIPALDIAEDTATLGAGKYTYYVLEWVWPLESGNDELDTQLGNLAADMDITFTIAIKTTATESKNPSNGSGITPPQTGDNTILGVWIALAIGSFAMLLFLIIFWKKEQPDQAEAKTVEEN